ncbi:hypothetical protein [Dyella sp. M7H15-1]|uniref:hypothetical protein n=1 Tax=Dyella sp. M7H15-1 TaxID=2501295 RepID=UPI0013E8D940|nr:hypothetical protein [Dyella sp. M7H15-1]
MHSYASKSNAISTTPRAFARITAIEVTQAVDEQSEEGLFLTITTNPTHPEPEFGIFGG